MSEEQQNNKPEEYSDETDNLLGIISGIFFSILFFMAIYNVLADTNFTGLIIIASLAGIYIYFLVRSKKHQILRVFLITILILLSICGGCTAFFFRR